MNNTKQKLQRRLDLHSDDNKSFSDFKTSSVTVPDNITFQKYLSYL